MYDTKQTPLTLRGKLEVENCVGRPGVTSGWAMTQFPQLFHQFGDTFMNIPIRSRLLGGGPARAALIGTVLALGFGAMGAIAQTATSPSTPTTKDTPPHPTNAQLEAENQKLRLQLAQLKEAQKTPSDASSQPKGGMGMAKQGKQKCKEGMSMGMDKPKDCKDMPDSGAAKDAPGKPMKKDGMGMMEKEHSMDMPAPNTDTSQDPPMKDH